MESEFLGLRTAIYKVNDLKAAIEWYSRILRITPYFVEDFYVGFNVGGYELGLLPDDSPADSKTDNVSMYWGVEDIKATYKRLLEYDALGHEEPTDVGGGIMVATVKDPWGNVFGIIYNPFFKLPAHKNKKNRA
jgi:lactoylglutathione lyase